MVGLSDVIIVDTPDALLVARVDESQNVKEVVEQLKAAQRAETEAFTHEAAADDAEAGTSRVVVNDRVQMGTTELAVGDEEVLEAAFPGVDPAITYDNMGIAIGAFERGLVTPGRFDEFASGKRDALSEQELRGFDTFVKAGCPTCHMGPAIGGTMLQKLGLIKPYKTEDTGRFKVTENEAEMYFFKVPSLRNIAETGPYFHDGKVATLDEAVKLMAWHQLGKKLEDAQIQSIVTFLKTTTGEIPTEYVAAPELPASGPKTPKPDPT